MKKRLLSAFMAVAVMLSTPSGHLLAAESEISNNEPVYEEVAEEPLVSEVSDSETTVEPLYAGQVLMSAPDPFISNNTLTINLDAPSGLKVVLMAASYKDGSREMVQSVFKTVQGPGPVTFDFDEFNSVYQVFALDPDTYLPLCDSLKLTCGEGTVFINQEERVPVLDDGVAKAVSTAVADYTRLNTAIAELGSLTTEKDPDDPSKTRLDAALHDPAKYREINNMIIEAKKLCDQAIKTDAVLDAAAGAHKNDSIENLSALQAQMQVNDTPGSGDNTDCIIPDMAAPPQEDSVKWAQTIADQWDSYKGYGKLQRLAEFLGCDARKAKNILDMSQNILQGRYANDVGDCAEFWEKYYTGLKTTSKVGLFVTATIATGGATSVSGLSSMTFTTTEAVGTVIGAVDCTIEVGTTATKIIYGPDHHVVQKIEDKLAPVNDALFVYSLFNFDSMQAGEKLAFMYDAYQKKNEVCEQLNLKTDSMGNVYVDRTAIIGAANMSLGEMNTLFTQSGCGAIKGNDSVLSDEVIANFVKNRIADDEELQKILNDSGVKNETVESVTHEYDDKLREQIAEDQGAEYVSTQSGKNEYHYTTTKNGVRVGLYEEFDEQKRLILARYYDDNGTGTIEWERTYSYTENVLVSETQLIDAGLEKYKIRYRRTYFSPNLTGIGPGSPYYGYGDIAGKLQSEQYSVVNERGGFIGFCAVHPWVDYYPDGTVQEYREDDRSMAEWISYAESIGAGVSTYYDELEYDLYDRYTKEGTLSKREKRDGDLFCHTLYWTVEEASGYRYECQGGELYKIFYKRADNGAEDYTNPWCVYQPDGTPIEQTSGSGDSWLNKKGWDRNGKLSYESERDPEAGTITTHSYYTQNYDMLYHFDPTGSLQGITVTSLDGEDISSEFWSISSWYERKDAEGNIIIENAAYLGTTEVWGYCHYINDELKERIEVGRAGGSGSGEGIESGAAECYPITTESVSVESVSYGAGNDGSITLEECYVNQTTIPALNARINSELPIIEPEEDGAYKYQASGLTAGEDCILYVLNGIYDSFPVSLSEIEKNLTYADQLKASGSSMNFEFIPVKESLSTVFVGHAGKLDAVAYLKPLSGQGADEYIEPPVIDPDTPAGLCIKMANPSAKYVYTGSAITPRIFVYADHILLTENTDYTVKYSNNVNAGEGLISVKCKGDYSGTATEKFTISPKNIAENDTEGGTLSVVMDHTFFIPLGAAFEPVMTYGGYKLTAKDIDYDKTDKNAQSDTCMITGKGNFTGTTEATVYRLNGNSSKFQVSIKKENIYYDGTPKIPTLIVKDSKSHDDITDRKGTFYDVRYPDDITNAGTVKITVISKGGYLGTKTLTYKILPEKINASASVKASQYDPAGAKPELTVSTADKVLTEDKDYKVKFSGNKKAGTGNYTVTFIGNYKGNRNLTGKFDINQVNIGKAKVFSPDVIYDKKAGTYESKPIVMLGDQMLTAKDYKVTYLDENGNAINKNNLIDLSSADTATVTVSIEGCGNYTGSVSGKYAVKKLGEGMKNLSKAKILGPDQKALGKQMYTGDVIEPAISVKLGTETVDPTCYEKLYFNNVKKGKAVIIVIGKNSYAGSAAGTFNIVTKVFKK